MSTIAEHVEKSGAASPARKLTIAEESSWRCITTATLNDYLPSIDIGRWNKRFPGAHELIAPIFTNYYTIDVLLGDSYVDLFRDEIHVVGKKAGFGSTQIAAPGQSIRCRFDRSTDAIHLFISRSTIEAACEDLERRICLSQIVIKDPCFATDPIMGKLVEAIVHTQYLHDAFVSCYAESLIVALLTRVIGTRSVGITDRSFGNGLVQWRLRRAIDFIEENLGEPISLSDIARQAGLSRMHFAAQFRRATGLTPHNFLVLRRVELAKRMLCNTRLELVEIAARVGFRSQAYFTTVFRKSTGVTPSSWRRDAL
jgi:AraC family transcriptional regulator